MERDGASACVTVSTRLFDFFFSSRRRHTRCSRDWSSDVCSSDLFASVEDKRKGKNYSRMALFQSSEFVLERKCLGLLALPLITLNGLMRSANNPLGNALEHFCGYNYQHHTLDKFLRELKYLGISDRLLREQVWFWRQHWQEFESSGLPFLCYYVDGNTTPAPAAA